MTIASDRADVARAWARALATTSYVSRSRSETENLLRDLLDGLFETLTSGKFSPDPAREIGTRLVAEHFTSEESVRRTVEVLGQALLTHPELQEVEDLPTKAVTLLGAIGGAHSAALRSQTLDQQEQMKRALLQARRHAERELQVSEAKFRELFTSSAVGIVISDLDGTVVEANKAITDILGDRGGGLTGRSVYELLHPADVEQLTAAHQELLARRRTHVRLPQPLRLLDNDAEPVWTQLAVCLLHDADNNPTQQFMTVENVTELHLLGERLRDQSLHDALTGLPNQQYFVTSLERVLAGSARVTVFVLNVDGMAVVNDGFGRTTGDELLQTVADRLRTVFSREKATVARFGADNFAVFVENSPTTPDAAALVSKINTELAEPVYFEDFGLAVFCSIGVAQRQDRGGADPAELIRAAESALRRARHSGRRQWDLFDRHRDTEHRAHCRRAAAMPGAWEIGEIGLDYQPSARLSDNAVTGVEALLRWDQAQGEVLAHRECLDLAAWTGLELPLVRWMLHQACEQFAAWPVRAPALLHVDLTPRHAHDPDLLTTVRHALAGAGLAPQRLRLGIPASALDQTDGEAVENLQLLSELGVVVALLDCCGTRSAAQVEDLSVPTVELAPHIVRRISQGTGSAVTAAVAPIVRLMHAAGATVMVRGIATREQAEWWRAVGADLGQGAYFGPPGPSGDVLGRIGPSYGYEHRADDS